MINWNYAIEDYNDSELYSFLDYLDDYSNEQVQELVKEIDDWPTKTLENAHLAVSYAGLTVTDDFLKQVLKNRLDLAMETFTNGINDTCQREMLIDAVVHELGINQPWPMNGTPKDVKYKFFEELIRKTMGNPSVSYKP